MEKVLARTLRPGDVVSFIEGDCIVKTAGYGDANIHGLFSIDGKTAAPWVIEFEKGPTIAMHPGQPVWKGPKAGINLNLLVHRGRI